MRISGRHRVPAPGREDALRVDVGGDAEDGLLGQVDGPDPEVDGRVLDALHGERDARPEQRPGTLAGQGAAAADPRTGGLEDVARHGIHRRSGTEVACRGDPVEVTDVEGDEPPGGVEDVDGGGLPRVGVPHGSGEDDADAVLPGECVEPGRVTEAGRGALGPAVADDLDGDRVARQQGPPPSQRRVGPGALQCEDRTADVGVGTEQDDERAGATLGGVDARRRGQLGDELGRAHRLAPLTAEVGAGDEAAQPAPACARVETEVTTPGEDGHPRQPGVHDGAAADRGARPRRRTTTVRRPARVGHFVTDGEVDAEDRGDPGVGAGLDEPHRAVEPVPVGQGQRRLAPGHGPLHEGGGGRGAVLHGVSGGDVQVDEGVVHGRSSGPGFGPVRRRRRPVGRDRGEVVGQGFGAWHPEQVLDDLEEDLGLAQQVVGLAGAERSTTLDGRPLPGRPGEERRPLGQLGGDRGQHLPDAARARAP